MPVDTSAGRLSTTCSGKLAVGMPSCLEPRPKPRTTCPRQKYGRCLMTPSARGAGCGPVRASGGGAVEAVPRPPPDQPGDTGWSCAGRPTRRAHGLTTGRAARTTRCGETFTPLTEQKVPGDAEAASGLRNAGDRGSKSGVFYALWLPSVCSRNKVGD